MKKAKTQKKYHSASYKMKYTNKKGYHMNSKEKELICQRFVQCGVVLGTSFINKYLNLIQNTRKHSSSFIARQGTKGSILGYGTDVYDSSKLKKGDKHYTETFKCICTKDCDVKYRIVLNAKENCADLMYTGINHDDNWEGDSTKKITDERIERMIRESGRRTKKMTQI